MYQLSSPKCLVRSGVGQESQQESRLREKERITLRRGEHRSPAKGLRGNQHQHGHLAADTPQQPLGLLRRCVDDQHLMLREEDHQTQSQESHQLDPRNLYVGSPVSTGPATPGKKADSKKTRSKRPTSKPEHRQEDHPRVNSPVSSTHAAP